MQSHVTLFSQSVCKLAYIFILVLFFRAFSGLSCPVKANQTFENYESLCLALSLIDFK